LAVAICILPTNSSHSVCALQFRMRISHYIRTVLENTYVYRPIKQFRRMITQRHRDSDCEWFESLDHDKQRADTADWKIFELANHFRIRIDSRRFAGPYMCK